MVDEIETDTAEAPAGPTSVKSVPSLLKRAIEACGRHPFVTGLFAILSAVGLAVGVYGFVLDRGEARATTAQLDALSAQITDLSAQLLAATAPENGVSDPARQTLREAAATRVAEADPDAARDIAEGNVEEGFAALKARAAAEAVNAAQAWNDIGALAFDREQKTALEAYREVVRLTPQDSVAWSYISTLEVRHTGDIDAALKAAQMGLETADNSMQRAGALDVLGDAQLLLDDVDAAAETYAESVALSRSLLSLNPDSRKLQRDLVVGLARLGAVKMELGEIDAAMEIFQEGLKGSRKLLAGAPDDLKARRDVSYDLGGVGDAALAMDDVITARAAFEESLEITKGLLKDDPDQIEVRRDLPHFLGKLAETELVSGNEAAAKALYLDGLEAAKSLVEDFPDNMNAHRDLLVGYANLGDATGEATYWREARDVYRDMEARGQIPPADTWMIEVIEEELAAAEAAGGE